MVLVDHRMARHSGASQQQHLQEWDGIGVDMAWRRPSPTTDRTELRSACQVGLGLGSRSLPQALSHTLPDCLACRPRPMLVLAHPPGVDCVMGWMQIRSGVSGNKAPETMSCAVGLRADSEGRRSNSTPSRMHVMTAIGRGFVIYLRIRKVVQALFPIRRHSVVPETCLLLLNSVPSAGRDSLWSPQRVEREIELQTLAVVQGWYINKKSFRPFCA